MKIIIARCDKAKLGIQLGNSNLKQLVVQSGVEQEVRDRIVNKKIQRKDNQQPYTEKGQELTKEELLSTTVLAYQANMNYKKAVKKVHEEQNLISTLKTMIQKMNQQISSITLERGELRNKVTQQQKVLSKLRDRLYATKETIENFYDRAHQSIY